MWRGALCRRRRVSLKRGKTAYLCPEEDLWRHQAVEGGTFSSGPLHLLFCLLRENGGENKGKLLLLFLSECLPQPCQNTYITLFACMDVTVLGIFLVCGRGMTSLKVHCGVLGFKR